MKNDTMIRYTPETGYPVTKVARRRRVVASPDGGLPHDPIPNRVGRYLLNGLAGAFFIGAAAWLALGAVGHVNHWVQAGDAAQQASAAVASLDQSWAADAANGTDSQAPAASPLPASAAADFAPAADPAPGSVWGKLHVPALDLHDAPLYQGTTSEQINVGVGHYTDTAFPWDAAGNMGLAGHRTGWQELFNRMDELKVGDKVYVETKHAYFEYTITGSQVVTPTDTWVLDERPAAATGASGTSQLLTLTTCDGPDNAMRLAVWGEMTSVFDKATGPVPAGLA